MKKIIISLLSTLVAIGLTGCGGSMYNYKVEPTPIKQETAKYQLKDFNLVLKHGHGRNMDNKTFKNQEELSKSFVEFINQELEKQSLKGDSNTFQFSVNMDYTRKYNYGGNALNKPEFIYTVSVYDNSDKLLADYTIPKSTTKYASFKDVAVNLEIVAYEWDAEDEPLDIQLISKVLVEELSELGD